LTVAIGLSQKPERELDLAAMRRDGVGLVRRQSGGGAVLLGPGVLCWEAAAPLPWLEAAGGAGIHNAYAVLSRPIVEALRRLGLEVFQAGICDLSIAGAAAEPARKLAGTAQLRRKNRVLAHGSLLLDIDLSLLSRYLKPPSEQPEYRAGRGHAEFCQTAADKLGLDAAGRKALPGRLARAAAAVLAPSGWDWLVPPNPPPPAALRLMREKYLADAWNFQGRLPGRGADINAGCQPTR
jgi:hypothetical protein